MNIERHPCFNDKARHKFGRVHLPVAPRCNVQCNFCNRKYDCVSESRPGVTSSILSPDQAIAYLDMVMRRRRDIAVVGIAGPGDPFANPQETMETLRLVRHRYPEMILCVASNGLELAPYVEDLASLKVSHVTITVNAVDLKILEKIYAWVRYQKRVLKSQDGARLLLERQLEAIRNLKEHGVVVKVNSIIIPGINDHHVPEVARVTGSLGADILNAVPHYPNEGAKFAHITEPSRQMVENIRQASANFIPQMKHCTRCRADALGMLGEEMSLSMMDSLKKYERMHASPAPVPVNRPYVAVASREGVLVNQHLGEAFQLFIYGYKDGHIHLLETRLTPPVGGGIRRWEELAEIISDCSTVLVSGAGDRPRKALEEKGIAIMEIEGLVDEAVRAVYDEGDLKYMIKRSMTACGGHCSGGGDGCG